MVLYYWHLLHLFRIGNSSPPISSQLTCTPHPSNGKCSCFALEIHATRDANEGIYIFFYKV